MEPRSSISSSLSAILPDIILTIVYFSLLVTTADSLPLYAGSLFLYNAAYLFLGPYIIAGTAAALDPSGRLAAAMGGIMFFSYSVGIGAGGFIAELISLAGIGVLGYWHSAPVCLPPPCLR